MTFENVLFSCFSPQGSWRQSLLQPGFYQPSPSQPTMGMQHNEAANSGLSRWDRELFGFCDYGVMDWPQG